MPAPEKRGDAPGIVMHWAGAANRCPMGNEVRQRPPVGGAARIRPASRAAALAVVGWISPQRGRIRRKPLNLLAVQDSPWPSLQRVTDVLGGGESAISRRRRVVFNSGELERAATVAKNATTAAHGKTCGASYRIIHMLAHGVEGSSCGREP